ncbi:hypothetical protein PoB_002700700 [Plakobranchus ocellatus]|uniref:Uncharacterized protein n=1 Tax=Plakobranchus ocellatus TaxID=259542 RepID=A0AAV3ZZP3_9GAST|nr:hypothetical protein PoB_002700700 [Plakobranchus ocellatus]
MGNNETLHLVSSQGVRIRQLWSVPNDRDQDDDADYDEDDDSFDDSYDSCGDSYGYPNDVSFDDEDDDPDNDEDDDADNDEYDYMGSVATDGSVCICLISKGFVHTFDCL